MKRPTGVEAPPVQSALRVAFEGHYMPLLRLCTLLAGRQDVAEDLVQEAFIRIAPKIESIAADDIGAYLRRTAVNLWKNRIRRLVLERRHRNVREEPVPEASFEERSALWHAVTRLPARQRACLVLRYYEDLSEKSTAEILGCSVGTVKSQTSRALAHLRKELSDET
jgi:RNA polymerase sigma-70 factor (sigma-E family)